MPKDKSDGPSSETERALDEAVELAPRLNVPKDALRAALERLIEENARKKAAYRPGPIYDAVFRTVIERLGRLTILLVNHLFGTQFTGDEQIVFEATETVRRDDSGEYRSIRSDSHFSIVDASGKEHPFHIECSLRKDGTLLFRIAEYDMQLALTKGMERDWGWELILPQSAAVLLRSTHDSTEPWKYRITLEDGSYVEQTVRTLSLPALPVDDLFTKKLFALAPFYAFTYGKDLSTLEQTAEGQAKLLQDEQALRDRITSESSLTETEKIRLLELTTQVIRYLIRNETLKEKMEEIMYPMTIELESDRLTASSRAEGLAEGLTKGKAEGLAEGLTKGRVNGIIEGQLAANLDHAIIANTLVALLHCTPEEATEMIQTYIDTHKT